MSGFEPRGVVKTCGWVCHAALASPPGLERNKAVLVVPREIHRTCSCSQRGGAMTYNVDWPTGSEDLAERLACAVRVALDDAANHGADTSRVVFVGHSFGASVGAAVSLGGSAASADCAVAEGDALPEAFVGYEGSYDWAQAAPEGVPDGADPYAQIGGNPDLVLRLLHGDSGVTVPMSVSQDFAQTLADAGYDAEFIGVPGGDHGNLSEGSPAQQTIVDQVTDLLNSL